ncbi:hypothetical protein DM01DRAFT_1336013 [Hesseltinella vesiculosa]|uniref:Uncharacterized protein n=1 Tax=Hesseltinella vesiculosa TaxID=101127 RepID=A0A1X2GGL2_9FUNG|nr:hypothetical protein DM01DRAFT_1336013 [Hesseltinella vesiculosa]
MQPRTRPREVTVREKIEALHQFLLPWPAIPAEALALKYLCQYFLEERNDLLLAKWIRQDKHMDLDSLFDKALAILTTFKERDAALTALWGQTIAREKRTQLLAEFQHPFQRSILHDLNKLLKKANLAFPYYQELDSFQTDMPSPASYQFYQSVFGRQARPGNAQMWPTFLAKYQQQFGNLDSTTKACLQRLCLGQMHCTDASGKDDMSIFNYITLTRDYGFPLRLDQLPLLAAGSAGNPSSHANGMVGDMLTSSSFLLMQTTQMVWDFIHAFGSKETMMHVQAIHTWYQGTKSPDVEDRANQWAVALSQAHKVQQCQTQPSSGLTINTTASPPSPPYSAAPLLPTHHQYALGLPEKVDLGRRHVTCLYQKFMSLWRMNQYARDIFKDVDFPGHDNIIDMQQFILPLEHAHYLYIMHGTPSKWPLLCPKVYPFLEQLSKQ